MDNIAKVINNTCVVGVNMDDIANVVNNLLNQRLHSEVEIEVEARIKKQLINAYSQSLLVDRLGVEWSTTTYTERRRISKTDRKCAYRQRDSVVICKSYIAKEDINDAWCSLHVSIEIPTHSAYDTLASVEPVFVTRKRAEVDGHFVDIVYDPIQEYRVEVEVCDPTRFNREATMRVVKTVCTALQGSKNFVEYYDWFTIAHITKQSFGTFCIDKKQYQKPRVVTMKIMLDIANVSKWTVTPKVDGERRFIVSFDDRVFSVGLLKDVRFEGIISSNTGIIILDCEYANDKFYVFDAVVADGKYLGEHYSLKYRLDEARGIIDSMELFAKICIKTYYSFDSFERLRDLYDTFKISNEYAIDGMIFVRNDKGYMQTARKWKPHNTVDLVVTPDVPGIMTSDKYPVDIQVQVPPTCTLLPGSIWEFSYDRNTNILTAVRPRPDKPTANSKKIVMQNMFRSVSEHIFYGIGCHMMRGYHNSVKRNMISGACKKQVILDIGTGQGGDVVKWKTAETRLVYCVEPRPESIQHMMQRHGKDEEINVLSSDSNLIPDKMNVLIINTHLRDMDSNLINHKINVFTAFFCMNLFEDIDFEALKKLIKEKGAKKCTLLATAITRPANHDNKYFKMVVENDSQYSIDIHNTRILGLRERQININVLAKRLNMTIVKRELLNDQFMTKEERKLSSMYEMFVLKV